MNGKENINPGDILMCISNSGLCSIGDTIMIYGITESGINYNGSETGWTNRDNFRWHNFKFLRSEPQNEQVLKFKEKQMRVSASNKKVLETRRQQLDKIDLGKAFDKLKESL